MALLSKYIFRNDLKPLYRFLLTGGVAIGEDTEANPFSDWLPDKSWAELGRIGDLPSREHDTEHELNDFRNKFKENISEWKKEWVKNDLT